MMYDNVVSLEWRLRYSQWVEKCRNEPFDVGVTQHVFDTEKMGLASCTFVAIPCIAIGNK
jgi:hypothetical protein